jgi:hypothetical protein
MIHVAGKRLNTPRALIRPSVIAWALSFSVLGAAVVVPGPGEARAAAESSQLPEVPLIYHKGRNFRIPFNLNPEGRNRIKEVRLLVSQDSGYHWRPVSKTFPDHPTFTFRSPRDGEYWFAVQTLTVDGKVSPRLDATVEPSLKVVVDTLRPSLLVDPAGRRGSMASVRWEVKDENLDLKTLFLEYQVEGVGAWRRVPIGRPKLIGSRTWDAGTAEALKVRMSVADRAGNVTETVIDLAEGTASPPEVASSEPEDRGAPAVEHISNAVPRITAGPDFTPVEEDVAPSRPTSPGGHEDPVPNRPVPGRATRPRARSHDGAAGRPRPTAPDWDQDPGPPAVRPAASAPVAPVDLFATANGAALEGGFTAPSTPANPGPPPAAAQPSPRGGAGAATLLVDSPRFKLQYAVDDAGPNGPSSVELWITQDGGRTWIRRGDDPDRVSPIEVDLGGEGTYGICLVARSASGLGDQPPAPGEPPQTWVEVDATPPVVQLDPPQVGTGKNSGKVAIAWRATDLHLAPKSVCLFWRPDQPGAGWQPLADGQENIGHFIWTVPPTVPPRFHIRVEGVDTLGHRGWAETTDTGAIIVDRSRPRSRIIGLDPNARAGMGPAAWPMR